MVTTVQNGVAIKVHGNAAHTHDALCTNVSRYPERTYHPQRVLQPLRRIGPKGSGQFEPVSWNEALQDIGQRLRTGAARPAGGAHAAKHQYVHIRHWLREQSAHKRRKLMFHRGNVRFNRDL
jgi:anaerobic selenocysteine-containing dehydrogenase